MTEASSARIEKEIDMTSGSTQKKIYILGRDPGSTP
jgi:hypothetical protein